MKLLAIDYGAKRIGLALGELENNIVVPYSFIENKGRDFVLAQLKNICEIESVRKIVIGIPVHRDMESKQVRSIEDFIKFLKKNLAIDVVVYDESFTSKIAGQDERYKNLLKDRKKGWRDMLAATEILRSYIEKNN
ncbi:MAG: Holliday junction resolvase RuvX [bacterium]